MTELEAEIHRLRKIQEAASHMEKEALIRIAEAVRVQSVIEDQIIALEIEAAEKEKHKTAWERMKTRLGIF